VAKQSLGLITQYRNADEEERKDLLEALPHKVGFMKPPQEHQFKPGNRMGKGRPKGSRNIGSIIEEELKTKIEVKENGRTRKVDAVQVMVRQLVHKAAQGDSKAALQLLDLARKNGVMSGPAREVSAPFITPEDFEVVKSFEKILGSSHMAAEEEGAEK